MVGENGEEPDTAARAEGGTRDGGRLAGISFPANFFFIRCMATANPSLVKQPSLLMSARSLNTKPSLNVKIIESRKEHEPNLSQDFFRQI